MLFLALKKIKMVKTTPHIPTTQQKYSLQSKISLPHYMGELLSVRLNAISKSLGIANQRTDKAKDCPGTELNG